MKKTIKLQRFVGFHLDHDTFRRLRRGTLLGGISVSNALRVLVQRWVSSKYNPIITNKEVSKFPGAGRPLGKD